MSLTILNENAIRDLLTSMWKKALNTNQDPANGKNYTSGPNGSGGLYGGLTDTIDNKAVLDETNKLYTPSEVLGTSELVNNINGLQKHSTVTLTAQATNSVSATQEQSNSVHVGAGVDFKVNAEIFELTTKFSIDYTYTASDSRTWSKTNTATASAAVDVDPPTGKVYKAVLVGKSRQVDIPYKVFVTVRGTTSTWFESRVKAPGDSEGHYNFNKSIGDAFATAGDPNYLANGDDGRVVAASGVLTAQQISDFEAQIWDVTTQYTAPHGVALPAAAQTGSAGQKLVASTTESGLPDGAVLISRIPVVQTAAAGA
jgi:hypothetical protein